MPESKRRPTMAEQEEEVVRRLGFHPPATERLKQTHILLRRSHIYLGKLLVRLLPESRERSLALTHLQECLMWANAAVAMESPVLDEGYDMSPEVTPVPKQ